MSNDTFESIRDQWKSRAESLTAFVSQHLENRTDAYGNYRSVDDRTAGTARTIKSTLTSHTIQRHFMADDRGDLIGLHTTSPENTCRWLVIDIDHHGESDLDPEYRNEAAAIAIRDKLENQGITSLLMRSNGRGGFHLWVIFNAPVETATVYRFGQWIVVDWQELGLGEKPEVFPKQDQLAEGKLGNWVRLPGLHHTYDFFTEVWSGDSWLQGQEAIDAICNHPRVAAEDITSERFALSPAKESAQGGVHGDTEEELKTPLELVLSRLHKSFRSGTGYAAYCPAHNDAKPSLSINEAEDGKVLMHCHAGCDLNDILSKLELTTSDLFSDSGQNSGLMLRQMHPATDSRSIHSSEMEDLHRKLLKETPEDHLKELADELNVSLESLRELDVVWSTEHTCWLFPERDGQGSICGLMRRYSNGKKYFIQGGKRGLYIPKSFKIRSQEIIVVEGGSDTAAGLTLGWNVIGRPSAGDGAFHLASLLKKAEGQIYVLGDNDPKRDGTWPGRRGAEKVANTLQKSLTAPVSVTSIPMEFKDLRMWVQCKGVAG
jgi:hypothetical protein